LTNVLAVILIDSYSMDNACILVQILIMLLPTLIPVIVTLVVKLVTKPVPPVTETVQLPVLLVTIQDISSTTDVKKNVQITTILLKIQENV
jgi:hypothetical protein